MLFTLSPSLLVENLNNSNVYKGQCGLFTISWYTQPF